MLAVLVLGLSTRIVLIQVSLVRSCESKLSHDTHSFTCELRALLGLVSRNVEVYLHVLRTTSKKACLPTELQAVTKDKAQELALVVFLEEPSCIVSYRQTS